MAHESSQRPVVAVRDCVDESEADVIMSLLRAGGIESFLTPQISRWVLPMVAAAMLDGIKVYVDEANADAALKLIEESARGDESQSSDLGT